MMPRSARRYGFRPALTSLRRLLALAAALLAILAVPGAASAGEQRAVVIEAMRYAPQTIEAQVGDVIVWSNRDPFPHTVDAQDRSFASGEIPPGGEWRLHAARTGIFEYHCALHPTMHGTLLVK
jgi:plastocyanin